MEERDPGTHRPRRLWPFIAAAIAVVGVFVAIVLVAGRPARSEEAAGSGLPRDASAAEPAHDEHATDASPVDATVATPPIDSAIDGTEVTTVALVCRPAKLACTAELSETPQHDQTFEVRAHFTASDPSITSLIAGGTLDGRLEVRDKRSHALLKEVLAPIERDGSWRSSLRLPGGTYHAHIDLVRLGSELDSATLDDLTIRSAR